MIDFKAEVDKRRDEMMTDLKSLLEINSERNDQLADKEHPFGPGPVKALHHFLEMAKKDGYKTKNVDNYAGHFEYGEGDEVLGIFAHLDVVPAGSDWDTDPYQPVIKEGKLYARGASDDKGPTIACYYGLKIIKELQLPLKKKVRFVLGTDEESGWADMDYYFKHVNEKEPDFGFSPDAEFPIINGEKGNITSYLHLSGDNAGEVVLEKFTGGLRENMVPERAKAIISGHDVKKVEKQLKLNSKSLPITIAIKSLSSSSVEITAIGRAAHGSTPSEGINAATYLAVLLQSLPFEKQARTFIDLIADQLHLDFNGEKIGLNHQDDKMGNVSMNAAIFDFDQKSSSNTIALNFRYPQGLTPEKIQEKLEKLPVDHVHLADHGHTPHYVPMEDELVTTLLSVYEKHTGQKGYEQVIGGGTFGRLLKRGVAFGAMFPGYTNTMHQANEFADIEDLFRAAAIYAEAIYELAK